MTIQNARSSGRAAGCLLACALAMQAAAQADPPNIVFFLVDDLGSADCGFAGGTEIQTPRIDALAAGGTILDALYVQPVCSPTRACLMTGRYPTRTGVYTIVRPHAPWGLPLAERTLADALKAAGYQTAVAGKWHLGEYQPAYVPTARGFDRQYGHYFGNIDHFTHVRDGQRDWYRDDKPLEEEGYATDLIAAEACRMIESRDPAKPLFLYVPFNAVHAPLQAPPGTTEPYAALDKNRRILAGMLASVDAAIGRIVDALAQAGIRDDTLIVFCGDNGGPKSGSNGPLRGHKGSLYEGGIRTCGFVNWPGQVPAGRHVSEPLHTVDWFPTFMRLAGGAAPDDRPLDGRDAWPTITAGAKSPHDSILVATDPERAALRRGDWKIVAGPQGRAELFNLVDDPGERRDLAVQEPEKYRELAAKLAAALAGAVPTGAKAPPDKAPRKPQRRPATAASPRPNVLILYADDLGYADLSVTGNREIATPHIDSLAANGVRFTTSYVTGCVCSPSRAGLMTGRYQQRFGFDANAEGSSKGLAQPKGLDLAQPTFADRFKQLGYATGLVGKWHLGSQKPEYLPNARGFDEFYGLFPSGIGAGNEDEPVPMYRNGDRAEVPADHTKAFGEEAEAFIARHKDEPWLLSCAFTAVHSPHVSPAEYEARLAHVSDPRRRYLAMLACLDDVIGGILGTLRRHGLEERTLVFFASDNGGPAHAASNGVFRGSKWTLWEGGVRSPILVQWKGRIPGGRTLDDPVLQIDWLPTALAAAGATIDPAWKLDGVNLLPLLTGDVPSLPPRPLFWRFGVQYAVRQGNWKLVKAKLDMPPALFDVVADPGEAHDLAASNPAKAKELQAVWDAWNAGNEPPRWIDERWNGNGPGPKKNRKRPQKAAS
jgi:arylsulfatase A-like enzyme